MDTHLAEAADLRDRAYRHLRELLMSGTLPVGRRLVTSRLTEVVGVSRTPLREALVRLHADGLVTQEQDGYHPVVLDLLELRDLCELRITLELRCITRALEDDRVQHDTAAMHVLRQQWLELEQEPPPPGPDVVLLDEDFHVGLAAASGNPALTEALRTVNGRIRLVRMYDYLTRDRVRATITEHLSILDHVLAGRLAEGLRTLHQHVGDSLDVVEGRAERALTARALAVPPSR